MKRKFDFRFVPALAAGRILMHFYKAQGKERSDHAGMASMRLCPSFLKYVKKPPLLLAVTGTNGKTSVSAMVTDILRLSGKTVSYNDWGANHHAGHARCMLDAVNIFNQSTKDVAVIEMDELISPLDLPPLCADYMIVTNIGRDSMFNNAHPDYIREKLEKAAQLSPQTTLLVNADCPLCCHIGDASQKRVFFGVNDLKITQKPTLTDDFSICPVCGEKIVYAYRNYRHIGSYFCPVCGFQRPECDYFVEKTDFEKRRILIREPGGSFWYPINKTGVHHIYNYVSVIVLMREMGMAPDTLCRYLEQVYPPTSRESKKIVNDRALITVLSKGQNVSASSTTFSYVAGLPEKKCLILLLDEYFERQGDMETAAWIFDTDYEYLNDDNILQIIVAGDRYLDHQVRLLMAGIPREKLVCMKDYHKAASALCLDAAQAVYILHDVNFVSRGQEVAKQVEARLQQQEGTI